MDVSAVEPSDGPEAAPTKTVTFDNAAESQGNEEDDQDGSNKFQKAIAAWRNIDFANLIPSLDTTASDLVAHQRESLVERKDLAQKTKDFRKLDDAAKIAEIKPLLKAYQTYIDLVSNQSKNVYSTFLQLYSSLSEAPDPYPLLEASVDSLVTAEVTVPTIEAENKQLQRTNARLTTQLEEAERRLSEEHKARQQLEQERDAKVKEIQESWSAVLTEKQDNWAARERSLEERAENQERLLKELKASYEVSQRLDRNAEQENTSSGRPGVSAAELEIVSSDLERANARLADVEARNEQLRLELAQAASQKVSGARETPVEDDPAFLRLRSENSSLLRKVDAARLERDGQRREWDGTVRTLKREISALQQDSESLRAKLQKCADYDEVKEELEILKSIEFSTGDQEIDVTSPGVDSSAEDGGAKNLESLLLSRNKRLNDELTLLRVAHTDATTRLNTLQEEMSTTNMELEKARELNATLENDLAQVQSEAASNAGPALSVAGSRYPAASQFGRKSARASSPTSSIISGFDTAGTTSGTLESLRAGESGLGGPGGGGSSILPMVTAQRDRFRKRNSELETELQSTYQVVQSLRSEVAALQKDNLNLYEKTRYVSTFRAGAGPNANGHGYGAGPSGASQPTSPYGAAPGLGSHVVPINDYNLGSPRQDDSYTTATTPPLDRYRSAYESRISPFAAFRGRESARALKRMTLPERLLFQVTRVVLATRTSRNLFAMYCVALHGLVVMMLWWATTGITDAVPVAVPVPVHAAAAAAAGKAGAKVARALAAAGDEFG